MMKRRVQAAVARRAADVRGADPQALVLVIDGEKDGLPGLLVHSYGGTGGYLVCQFNAAGVEAWKVTIVQALIAATGCANVFERSDELLRKGEGLPVIWRALAGEEPPQRLMVRAGSRLLPTDIRTGFVYPR
jgi:23S rRNA (cytosine1962-C5)-methyltransferase